MSYLVVFHWICCPVHGCRVQPHFGWAPPQPSPIPGVLLPLPLHRLPAVNRHQISVSALLSHLPQSGINNDCENQTLAFSFLNYFVRCRALVVALRAITWLDIWELVIRSIEMSLYCWQRTTSATCYLSRLLQPRALWLSYDPS
jgi:hypothetical protein